MDTRKLLLDSAERMLADHCDKALLDKAEQGHFPEALQGVLKDAGFLQLAMSTSELPLSDAMAILRVAGRFALPLPLAETLLGNRWLGRDDVFVAVGPGDAAGAWSVPWARQAALVIAVSPDAASEKRAWLFEEFEIVPGFNLAGEPRERVIPERAEALNLGEDGYALLALSRAVLMAGGLERALQLSLEYVTEREQFGRPIAKFQAVQHYLAVMAAETAAASRAADAALAGIGGERMAEEIAAAKIRVGEAVGVVVELAQQVHGAMGYTYEHQLHHFSRRLWSWRDEFGNERFWQERLGARIARLAAAGGPDALWEFIATRG